MKNKKLKNDLILIFVLLLLIVISFIFINPDVKGKYVSVSVNGTQTAQYELSKDFETDIVSNGVNHLVIKNGEAYISSADCKNLVCVNSGKIKKTGETIVCLPHNLIIEIVSE